MPISLFPPSPSTPKEAGVSVDVIKQLQKPILGVCLGHQSIAYAFGGEIIRAKNLMHGKTSNIEITIKDDIFKELPQSFRVTRYHSLVVNPKNLPKNIIPTSFSLDDNEIMSIRVKDRPIYGVQFHPESICSPDGLKLLENFENENLILAPKPNA